nr:PH domain-containing protein [Lachnospiraceae bacterium]
HGQSLGGMFASVVVLLSLTYTSAKNIVDSFLRTYNYKVRRKDDHIYISSGAIKIRSYSVPVKQIQALRFQSTLLGRFMGRVSVSVINVSGEGEDVDGQWLFPSIEKDRIKDLMKQVLPEIPLVEEEDMIFRPQKSMIRSIIWTVFSVLIISVLAFVMYNETTDGFYQEIGFLSKEIVGVLLPIAIVIVLMIWIVIDVVRQSTEKILILDDRVAVRKGSLSWQQIEVSYDKIQMLGVEENVIDRLLQVKRGRINLLASMVASNQEIPEFDAKVLEELQEKYRATIK